MLMNCWQYHSSGSGSPVVNLAIGPTSITVGWMWDLISHQNNINFSVPWISLYTERWSSAYFCTKPLMKSVLWFSNKIDNCSIGASMHPTNIQQNTFVFKNTHFHPVQATHIFKFNTLTVVTIDEQHSPLVVWLSICYTGFNLENSTTFPFVPTSGTQGATLPYTVSIPIMSQREQWKQVITECRMFTYLITDISVIMKFICSTNCCASELLRGCYQQNCHRSWIGPSFLWCPRWYHWWLQAVVTYTIEFLVGVFLLSDV